ncbi:MAG: alpha-amylase family glycosyl hydrolase [Thermodesulfobacteriota bacterium]|nr:alpha-amylase family glycosyl hydrolase [Thermodesulfobacteriota bacterium]
MYEFHISRQVRDRYNFDEALFSINGNVVFTNLKASRAFADKINRARDVARHPELSVSASDINAMGLIDEILHHVVDIYRRDVNPNVMTAVHEHIAETLGRPALDKTLRLFVELFPPVKVYRFHKDADAYLRETTGGVPNRLIELEEMLLLYLANCNPAFKPFDEFFSDDELKAGSDYDRLMKLMESFFKTQPVFGPNDNNTLIEMLKEPVKAARDSLSGQLEYIRTHWQDLVSSLLLKVLGGIDMIKEEHKPHFLGPGPAMVPRFGQGVGAGGAGSYEEIERFSPDEDWMPRVVLMAKSIHVWLDQLSQQYGRAITRLDQIPDEEFEKLARWGFTGLWLIGVWERSSASSRIKQLTGNPEALSSAYSIYDYTIAGDLGGEEALEDIKARAWHYGIRMATDMVPNHMGIYSRWVIEHPERFVQLEHSPFPAYCFSGPNLSEDERVELYIEDGYWNKSDAAVVFKRVDRYTGDVRYIYHGNDGTSMPWNDTAQLDMLKHEVRQAVIDQTIAVAHRFPIIRFDAAMTLAKKHFQRLWYPLPGYGGDIPSRSGHSTSQEEFQRLFPEEFWRELVDRVSVEAPDTLLLAEAFWMMEGYFVRSLGMHRVYNSAFMNMLKSEENSKYRNVIKNVLRFNPEILRRFVNFMNNPDEEPAVEQFGKDDKYFGIATLMVTMPGVPMFGHGQVEGFGEKYGMEYRKAYWKEETDEHLIRRHEQEIFPLLHKRHLFSNVDNFVLYDVITDNSWVNEDVFAFSNRYNDQRALVVYNNRYKHASGWISRSVGISAEQGGRRKIIHKTLAQGLDLKAGEDIYYIFEDQKNRLEFIRAGSELAEKGIFIDLGAFKANVFINYREVKDDHKGQYRQLARYLGGYGVENMDEALQELELKEILEPFRALMAIDTLRGLIREPIKEISVNLKQKITRFMGAVKGHRDWDVDAVADDTHAMLTIVRRLHKINIDDAGTGDYLQPRLPDVYRDDLYGWRILLIWTLLHQIGGMISAGDQARHCRDWMDEYLLKKIILRSMQALGCDENEAAYDMLLIGILVDYQEWGTWVEKDSGRQRIIEMLQDADVQLYIGLNEYNGVWWFNRESFEALLYWLTIIATLKTPDADKNEEGLISAMGRFCNLAEQWGKLATSAGYDLERLCELLDDKENP